MPFDRNQMIPSPDIAGEGEWLVEGTGEADKIARTRRQARR